MKLQLDDYGKVCVTIEEDYWDINKTYEKITIVEVADLYRTYISRKDVPAGTELSNREYWIPFSSLQENVAVAYTEFTTKYGTKLNLLNNSVEDLQEALTSLRNSIVDIVSNYFTTPEDVNAIVQTYFSRLNSSIGELQTSVNNTNTNLANEITRATNKETELETSISSIQSNIDTKIAQQVAATIAQSESSLEVLQQLAEFINSDAATASQLTARLTNAERDIADVKEDIEQANSRITEVNSNISNVSSSVTAERSRAMTTEDELRTGIFNERTRAIAAETTLNSTVSQLNETVQTNKTNTDKQLTTLEESVASNVEELNERIDNIGEDALNNLKTINGKSLKGKGDLAISSTGIVNLTQEQYNNLTEIDPDVIYNIIDAREVDLEDYVQNEEVYKKEDIDEGYYTKHEVADLLTALKNELRLEFAGAYITNAQLIESYVNKTELAEKCYTKTESDNRYRLKTESYTKSEINNIVEGITNNSSDNQTISEMQSTINNLQSTITSLQNRITQLENSQNNSGDNTNTGDNTGGNTDSGNTDGNTGGNTDNTQTSTGSVSGNVTHDYSGIENATIKSIAENSSLTAAITTIDENGNIVDNLEATDLNNAITLTPTPYRIDLKITNVQGYGELPSGYTYVVFANEHDGNTLSTGRPNVMSSPIDYYIESVTSQIPTELNYEVYAVKDDDVDYNNLSLVDIQDSVSNGNSFLLPSIYLTINNM